MTERPRIIALQDIDSAIWCELSACPHDRTHAWRVPVLATTEVGGDPDARTIVLRDVLETPRRLRFFTDARSPKVAQLAFRKRGVLVMWSPALSWQLRVQVQLEVLRDTAEVASRWRQLRQSRAALDYLCVAAPGSALPAAAESPPQAGDGHFAIIDAAIEAIDWLELSAHGHRRARFDAAGAPWIQP